VASRPALTAGETVSRKPQVKGRAILGCARRRDPVPDDSTILGPTVAAMKTAPWSARYQPTA
jgi:hypothetical protein